MLRLRCPRRRVGSNIEKVIRAMSEIGSWKGGLLGLVLLAACVLSPTVAADNGPSAAPDRLVVAIPEFYPPFSQISVADEPGGLLVDIWRTWSEKSGIPVSFRAAPFRETLAMLRDGRADVNGGLFRNAERDTWIAFTRPFYEVTSGLYHRRTDKVVPTLATLDGRRVAAIAGSHQATYVADRHPGIEVIPHDTPKAMLRSLVDGRVDAVLGEDATLGELLDRFGLRGRLVRAPGEILRNGLRAGVPSARAALAQGIDQGFAAISDAEMREIEARWIHEPARRVFRVGSSELKLNDWERAWLSEHPEIRVGVMTTWPPISYRAQDGSHAGITPRFFAALNKRLGDRMVLVPGPWKQLLADVKEKRLDAVMDITPNAKRAPFYAFTRPYLKLPHVIVGRRDAPPMANEQDLAGRTLALEKGFGNVRYLLENVPDLTVTEHADTRAALEAVARGEADAYAGNRAVAMHLIEREVMTNLGVVGALSRPPTVLTVGTRKDWPELRDILDKALATITEAERRTILAETGDRRAAEPLALTPDERAWLAEHDTVRVMVGTWPPFQYLEEGEPKGLAIEYVQTVLAKLGLRFDPVPILWHDALDGISRFEKVDLLPTIARSPKREELVAITQDYLSFPLVIFTRKDAPFISGLEDLSGQTVAVENNFITHRRLERDYPEIALRPVATSRDALSAVSLGKADAYVSNLAAGSWLIDKHGYANLKVAAPTRYENDRQGMGVRRDWPELAGMIDKALASMSEDEHAALRSKALTVRFEHGIDMATVLLWTGGVAAGAGLIIGVIVLWNRRLGREVAQRKKAQHELSDALGVISDSIDYASNIQRSLLPNERFLAEDLAEHFVIWQPRDVVGGDLYWYRRCAGGFIVAMADCTGHGVPGAFMTMLSTGALDRALRDRRDGDPAHLLPLINRSLKHSLGQDQAEGPSDDGLELGICRIDPGARTLNFAGARFSLFRLNGDGVTEFKGEKSGIGYRRVPSDKAFANHEIRISDTDRFYMITDGFIDQIGGNRRRMFGKKRFKELIGSLRNMPFSEQKARILDALRDYQGPEPRRDDVSVIGFRIG